MAMDFSKLKELARQLGGILVMQGDEPEFVILPYEKYIPTESQNVPVHPSHPTNPELVDSPEEDRLIETLNSEIAALKDEIHESI